MTSSTAYSTEEAKLESSGVDEMFSPQWSKVTPVSSFQYWLAKTLKAIFELKRLPLLRLHKRTDRIEE